MVNPITWQNVAAPDFSVALRGQAQAADLFRRAAMSASTGLTGFDDAQTDMVNQQAQANLLKYQDPAQLRAALESGALFQGLDQSRIRPETMTDANSKVAGLLTNSINTENLSQGVYDNQFKNAERLRGMEARPGVNALLSNASRMDLSAVAQLPPEEQARVLSSLNSGESGATTNRNAAIEYGETKQATSMYQNMVQSGMGPNAIRDYVQKADVSDSVKVRMGALFKQTYGGDLFGPAAKVEKYDPVPGAPMELGSVRVSPEENTYNTIYGDTQGKPSQNLVGMTVADKLKLGETQIASTKGTLPGTSDGTSAAGRYQIVNKTMREYGPKVLGKDWESVPFNGDTQERMGKFLYNNRIDGKQNMVSEWQGLGKIKGADAPGAWDGIPWEVANNVIAQFESNGSKVLGSNPTMADVRAYAAKAGTSAPVTAQAFKPVEVVPNPVETPTNAAAVIAQVAQPPKTFLGDVRENLARGINGLAETPGMNAMAPILTGASALIKSFGGTPEPVTPAVAKVAETGSVPAKIPAITNSTDAAVMVEALKKQSTQDIASGDLTSLSQNLDFFKDQKDFASDVTTRLMTLPAFKDADEGTVGNYIAKIVQEANVSPKVAGAALQSIVRKDAYVPGTNWLFNGNSTTENLGGMFGSTVVKEDALKNIINLVKNNREIGNKQMNDQAINSNVASMEKKVGNMAELEAAIKEQQIRVDAKIPNSGAKLRAMEADYEEQKQKFQKNYQNWQAKRP